MGRQSRSLDRATQPSRAVLYLRQSTYREESISLELQEAAGREYCKQHGYSIVAVEADPGISGRTWRKRPAVQRVMQMIENHDADVIVLWKWSRLSRARLDWAVAVDTVEHAGGRIESATESVDVSTSTGRLARGMLAEFAAFESERIGDMWKSTHERRRRLGLPASGGPRYGYDHENGDYTPNPTTGPVLAEMYRRYIAGEGFTRIAKTMNQAGIPNPIGNPWTRIRVTTILDSGFGAGKLIHKHDHTRDYYDGRHDGVITAEQWAAYQERRKDAPAAPHVIEPRYILTGLIRCGDCGAPMHVGNQHLVDYKCSRAHQTGIGRRLTITRHLADQAVKEWVTALAEDLDGRAQAILKTEKRDVVAINTHATVEAHLKKIDERLARLTVRYLDERIPEPAYQATLTRLTAERESLQARAVIDTRPQRREADARKLAPHIVELWDQATVLELRTMLATLIRQVRIHPPTRPGIGVWRERVEVIPVWEDETT